MKKRVKLVAIIVEHKVTVNWKTKWKENGENSRFAFVNMNTRLLKRQSDS